MSDRFAGQPRGSTLRGARQIAEYLLQDLLEDKEEWRFVYGLNREEYGLVDLAGRLTGFTNWLDLALAWRVGKRCRRGRQLDAEKAANDLKK